MTKLRLGTKRNVADRSADQNVGRGQSLILGDVLIAERSATLAARGHVTMNPSRSVASSRGALRSRHFAAQLSQAGFGRP